MSTISTILFKDLKYLGRKNILKGSEPTYTWLNMLETCFGEITKECKRALADFWHWILAEGKTVHHFCFKLTAIQCQTFNVDKGINYKL